MSRQIFLVSPKFNKKLIYASPTNKYQEFTNAYIYSTAVLWLRQETAPLIVLIFVAKQRKNETKLKAKTN
jgi:hypothetical protein